MKKIIIDPGHGGKDPGAVGANGLYESNANLIISKKLRDILKNTYSVILTRDKDIYIPLKIRAKMSDNWKADIFISIHCNAGSNPKANGIETLHYPTSSRGKRLADDIYAGLIFTTGRRGRGVKPRGDLTVLSATAAPACLIECGFVSNLEEEKLLQSDSFHELICKGIKIGVDSYFREGG